MPYLMSIYMLISEGTGVVCRAILHMLITSLKLSRAQIIAEAIVSFNSHGHTEVTEEVSVHSVYAVLDVCVLMKTLLLLTKIMIIY